MILLPDMGAWEPQRSLRGAAFDDPEPWRLDVLRSYDILDTPKEPAFDRIAHLAHVLLGMPMGGVTFFDHRRQWYKAAVGLDISEVPTEATFCQYTLHAAGITVVPDTRLDPRFAGHPQVTGGLLLRSYASCPMISPEGARIGTLCVFSNEPREAFSAQDRLHLDMLAGIAMNELELRRQLKQAGAAAQERELLLQEMDHRVRSSLRLVAYVLQAQAGRSVDRRVSDALYEAGDRITGIEMVHQHLRRGSALFQADPRAYLLALVGSLQQAAADEAAGRTITIRMPPSLRMSPDRLAPLGMVLTELVTNGLRHGHGTVEITVRRDGDAVAITVSDDGWGFPQATVGSAGIDDDLAVEGDQLGLRLVALLALPGGVSFDPERPHRITARMAA